MFSGISLKLAGYIGAGLAVVAFVLLAVHWKAQAADRKDKLETICQTTRDAADNPKLDCGRVVVQITELGKSVTTLKSAIASQNAAVNDLARKSDQAQAEAAQASQAAQTRARGAEATSERLRASARPTVPPSASCEPSAATKDAWR